MPEPAWSPFNLRNPQSSGSHGPPRQLNTNFRLSYGPKSDIGSQASPSDEGYFSHNTRSVVSNDPDYVNQELPAGLLSNMDGMNVESVTSEAPTMSRMPSDQLSLVSSRSGKSKKVSICHPKNADTPMEEASVTPMDIDIAVSGMENPFSVSPTITMPPVLDFLSPQSARHSFSSGPSSNPVGNIQSLSRPSRAGPTSAPHNAGIQKMQKSTRSRYHAPGVSSQPIQKPLLTTKTASRVPGRNSLKLQQSSSSSALSNAPQTKAEQQKELKKKSERQSHSPSPVDLESIMLEMIQKAKDQAECEDRSAEQSRPEKNAVLMDMVTKLLNKGPVSSNTGQRRNSKDTLHNDKKCPHPNCGFAVARDCDLRKHMKRHDRPYGCTYPKCHKRFGAKSDWKRHENSQHFQQEAFRCDETLPTGEVCGVHLHREGAFRNHLETQHKTPCEEAQKRLDNSKIGKNCQGSFWCGLCGVVKQLKERRNAAWDERFDHIAYHFEKEKRSIDDWICAEENRLKKDLLEEKLKRERFDDEDEREKDGDVDAIGDDDDAPQPRPQLRRHNMSGMSTPMPMPMPTHATTTSPPPPPGFVKASKRKRSVEDDTYAPRLPKRKQTTLIMNRYCVSRPSFSVLAEVRVVSLTLRVPIAPINCALIAISKKMRLL
ncbi:unnamed protein product [Alternaria alternata]